MASSIVTKINQFVSLWTGLQRKGNDSSSHQTQEEQDPGDCNFISLYLHQHLLHIHEQLFGFIGLAHNLQKTPNKE